MQKNKKFTRWRTLIGFSLSIALLTGASVALLPPTASQAASLESIEAQNYKNQISTKTNNYRTGSGLAKLVGSKHLDKIAQNWANHMARTHDYRHNPNVAQEVWSNANWNIVGENIAYGYADGNAVSQGWWNSPSHKANILNSSFNRIGIGYAKHADGRKYYVQVFGGPNSYDPVVQYSSYHKDPKSPFYDVRSKDKFFKEIKWMNDTKLSTGIKTSQGLTYSPKNPVTREAMAAFLYRAAKVKNYTPPARSPFVDVSKFHKFYKEIAWMKETGISTGVKTRSGIAFMPGQNVTREAMAAFIYRAEKANSGSVKVSFKDIPSNHKFAKEINWMRSQSISTGIKKSSGLWYEPKSAVTREAMAAFLYRVR